MILKIHNTSSQYYLRLSQRCRVDSKYANHVHLNYFLHISLTSITNINVKVFYSYFIQGCI